MKKWKAENLEDLDKISKELIVLLDSKIICFDGQMGAGKTTFISKLIQTMNSDDLVSSPTFSLVNSYKTPEAGVYHFDLYRLNSEEEAFDLGIEEYLESGNYCFIEWAEKIENLLENYDIQTVKISLEGNSRIFELI